MELYWFIPTGGDGRYLATEVGGRDTDRRYLQQIAQAVDSLGFAGALLPTGRFCEEAWVVASSLAAVTQRMKFIVAIRPALMTPALAARFASSFDRLSEGRLIINVVAGGSALDLAADGVQLEHDARYEQTDEFLTIWRDLLSGRNVNYEGQYLQIQNGFLGFPPYQKPYPPLFFGGASPIGKRVAAKHADRYLMWGEPPKQIAEEIKHVRQLADEEGRSVTFGLRLHVIVRETEAEAWEAADNLIRYVDDDAIQQMQAMLSLTDSVGQSRMTSLHKGRRENLVVSPNLWAGVGLVRTGAGTALVGDPQTVADRLQEYADLGIGSFILSGYPHLEEAYRTAELLFPLLPLSHSFKANGGGDHFTQLTSQVADVLKR